MNKKKGDILILGGGLCGLVLAYLLRNEDKKVIIAEASNRLGGRIHTISKNETPLELGATWLGLKHQRLTELLKALNLPIFEQRLGSTAFYEPISTSPPQLVRLPVNEEPSYRIKGGSIQLIKALERQLTDLAMFVDEPIRSLEREAGRVIAVGKRHSYDVSVVVSTLPPNLLAHTIAFRPRLPAILTEYMQATHTWMGESIKIALTFAEPFWRNGDLSGTVFSSAGPVSELYDHSTYDDDRFALKGFLNSAFNSASSKERLAAVLQQLTRYYGSEILGYLNYEEKVWSDAQYTFHPYNKPVIPHQNNGAAVFHRPYWEGKFYVAGSETALLFPGYMDGAIASAQWVADRLLSS